MRALIGILVLLSVVLIAWPKQAQAIPAFARQYSTTCQLCHAAYPRLNTFGEYFVSQNYRLPNWRDASTVDAKDEKLVLPKFPPLAIRAMGYVQGRQGKDIDPVTGSTGNNSDLDFQAPYMIKLLSSAPLSDHITYYFYAIFAEKGANGEVVVEDAWFRYDDLFGTGISSMFGQFQISDLMYPRELRLTVQDFMVYRMAGITYDRGIILNRDIGPFNLAVGAVNGSGISQNFNVDSPGYRRPDRMFDNDSKKTLFGRIGTDAGPATLCVFGLWGKQKNATGPAGIGTGSRDTDKIVLGADLSANLGDKIFLFSQFLWNRWEDFLVTGQDYEWFGGFAGLDYIYNDDWTFSLLYNYADAKDFDDTGTVFEGIDISTLTATASYYFMRNVKAVLEVNGDFLKKDNDADFVGHETKEGYVLIGFDVAF